MKQYSGRLLFGAIRSAIKKPATTAPSGARGHHPDEQRRSGWAHVALHVEHPTARGLVPAKQAWASGQRSGAMGLRRGGMTTDVLLASAIGNVERRCEILFARVPGRESRVHVVE